MSLHSKWGISWHIMWLPPNTFSISFSILTNKYFSLSPDHLHLDYSNTLSPGSPPFHQEAPLSLCSTLVKTIQCSLSYYWGKIFISFLKVFHPNQSMTLISEIPIKFPVVHLISSLKSSLHRCHMPEILSAFHLPHWKYDLFLIIQMGFQISLLRKLSRFMKN